MTLAHCILGKFLGQFAIAFPHPILSPPKILASPESPCPVWSYWSPIGCLPGWRTLARYGGYRGNKIPGEDPNQYRCLAVDRGICKGLRKKTSKTNLLVLQVGGYAKGHVKLS